MKKWTHKLGVAVAILIALLFGSTLYYYMPRASKVYITGTDVKRQDKKGANAGQTRDVRFVYANNVSDGKARAFRNEDNPWYFKFDSGDIAAEATGMVQTETADLAKNERQVVLAKYYGTRIPILSLYPNVLSLKAVAADYVHIPIFNIVFLIVLLAVFLWAGVKVRRLFRAAGTKARKLTGRETGSKE
ncbi:MAG: DUF1523 family protein [Polyangiales bacterium]